METLQEIKNRIIALQQEVAKNYDEASSPAQRRYYDGQFDAYKEILLLIIQREKIHA